VSAPPLPKELIGRFDGGVSHDQVLGFDGSGLYFNIWRGGTSSFVRQSTQQMR
jgi:hypothetical protein